MKRGLGLLVMMVSLVGTTAACKQASKSQEPPPPSPKVEAGSSSGSAADPWKQEAAKKDPLKSILFWKAEKDGKTTYLLGTMHMGVDPETRLPQIVWDKLDAAPVFAMEADIADPKLAKMMAREKGTLKDDLGPEYWAKLEAAVGASMARMMENMPPMAAAALMSLKNLPKTAPMDGVLLGRATRQNKKIVYLEEGALQATLLAKYMDLRSLKMMIDRHEAGKAQSLAMLDAYLAGDPDTILKVTTDEEKDAIAYGYTKQEYAEQMNDMLYKRNDSWIAGIEALHAQGNGFVAVGALHLIGPRSVLESLEKKGFKITRLTP